MSWIWLTEGRLGNGSDKDIIEAARADEPPGSVCSEFVDFMH
ncbi:uncharacterized protein ARMOST_06226 [Armillaria ostoyae]|uniref:Uncharacterized protein n=1 Tax=Armillaria ostoyae TaxID=47428 RepID=A0A284R2H0_ARMOS|nr:uncharacterized protein ARMOST_06226 [Armillaria ostoyae]